jgi:CRP/FNR family transcriptional regulator, cyclic AMP receptor protein
MDASTASLPLERLPPGTERAPLRGVAWARPGPSGPGAVLWPDRIGSLAGARACHAGRGEVLASEGGRPGRAWLIRTGAVGLRHTTRSGRQATLCVLGPGDVVGLEHVFEDLGGPDQQALGPEARALTDAHLLSVAVSALAEATRDIPEVARWLGEVAWHRAATLNRRLTDALTLPVSDRLVESIGDLALAHGRPVGDGMRLDVPLNQEELALLVGATRESVNRALRGLSRSGRIRRAGRFYVLRRP